MRTSTNHLKFVQHPQVWRINYQVSLVWCIL